MTCGPDQDLLRGTFPGAVTKTVARPISETAFQAAESSPTYMLALSDGSLNIFGTLPKSHFTQHVGSSFRTYS